MLYKNIIWINLLFFSSTSVFLPVHFDRVTETKKWVINENSSLSVNGSTNINKFSCEVPSYDQTDTLTVIKEKSDKEIVLSGNISLKVQSFDCHNSIMTRDLRKTLKETEFPRLNIRFLSLNKLPGLTGTPALISGRVEVEIAGAKKFYLVNYQISEDAEKSIHLLGSLDVNFSDFNLIPPKKLGGMIKTKDQLNVDFHLKMAAVN